MLVGICSNCHGEVHRDSSGNRRCIACGAKPNDTHGLPVIPMEPLPCVPGVPEDAWQRKNQWMWTKPQGPICEDSAPSQVWWGGVDVGTCTTFQAADEAVLYKDSEQTSENNDKPTAQ
jgi:hypothetical protein